jgi:capsular polysaccharide biosynthesis protein
MIMTESMYQRLLRLYPAPFREQFHEPMLQHFRDQRRDAQNLGGWFAMPAFTLRIVFDTAISAMRERFSKQNKREQGSVAIAKRVPSFRFLFIAFLIPLMAGVILNTALQPRTFMSTSRFLIHPKDNPQKSYDPYFMQTQFELLRSQSLLQDVASQLGLARTMAERYGIKVKFEAPEAAVMIGNQIQIRQARNTSLVELRAYSESASEAAMIANAIPLAYARRTPTVTMTMVDPGARPLRPVRPNVVLNIIVGLMLSSLLSAIASGLLRAAFGRRNRQPTAASS